MSALVVIYGERKLLVSKPDSLGVLIGSARTWFGLDAKQTMTFYFQLDWLDDEVEVTSSGYEYVHDKATVRLSVGPAPQHQGQTAQNPYEASNGRMMAGRAPHPLRSVGRVPSVATQVEIPDTISIYVMTGDKRFGSATIMVKSNIEVGALKQRISKVFAGELRNGSKICLSHDKTPMVDDFRPINEYGVVDDSRILFTVTH